MSEGGLHLPILSPSHFDYSIYFKLASRLKTEDVSVSPCITGLRLSPRGLKDGG
jgi:hypothetical protein